jgi:hypothetical protein
MCKLKISIFAAGTAEIARLRLDVRRTPESGHLQCTSRCLLWAISGHRDYSITSSAAFNRPNGTVRPNVLAVLRLITSSNVDD